MLEIRIHGYGGEGIVTLGELVAAAAMKTGKQVQTLPHFGVERRGAPVKALVRISDEKIYVHSHAYTPDILLLHNIKLLEAALAEGIQEKGMVIVNYPQAFPLNYPLKVIDATGIALREKLVAAGNVPYINIPLSGALAAHLNLPLAAIQEAIEEKWPGKAGQENSRVAALAYEIMLGGGK